MTASRYRAVLLLLFLAIAKAASHAADGIVIIGHSTVKRLDVQTVLRIYTGRVMEVDGVFITAVNAHIGSSLRNRFLQVFLHQDEDNYTAYWTVRRRIGQGVSPRELPNTGDIIRFVNSTPGAIGYIDESEIQPGLNILLR